MSCAILIESFQKIGSRVTPNLIIMELSSMLQIVLRNLHPL